MSGEIYQSEIEKLADSTVRVVGDAAPEAPRKSRNDDMTGKVLGQKFELISFIGSGGMSEVYKAKHRLTGKSFAVKVLHEKCSRDEVTVLRLKQEAQAAGALSHTNILGIHDFGIDDTGMPYLVMDFIDGMSLSELLKEEGTLKLDRFIDMMLQVSTALRHAQEQNVVHRDLKPSNIMVMNVGEQDHIKIVDFGIAKILGQDVDGTLQQLTKTGETFGSPLYMSPEQCQGGSLDPRSDIYAFGCVMYEALSGKPPHLGETVFDTIHRHINDPPPPLVAPQIDPNTLKRLEALILRCLAKDRQDRFQTFAEIESELRKLGLATGAGAVAYIENAWNLVQAKQAARKKTKTPLLVSALSFVSVLSILSSICLVFSVLDFARSYKTMYNVNRARVQYMRAYVDSTIIYKAGQAYLKTRDQRELNYIEEVQARLSKNLNEADDYLKDSPEMRERYKKMHRTFDAGIYLFKQTMSSLPTEETSNFSLFAQAPSLRRIVHQMTATQNQILQMQDTEDKELEILAAKVEQAQRTLISLGIFSLLLNSAVITTMIFHLVRQNRQLQKQKEQIVQAALESQETTKLL